MSQENIDLNTIAAQLAQQGQLIQQLLSQRSLYTEPIEQDEGMVPHQPVLHDLPVRPSYDWQPPQELYERIGSLSNPIFKQTLSDEERKTIVERYPAIQGLKYSLPRQCPRLNVASTKVRDAKTRLFATYSIRPPLFCDLLTPYVMN